MCYQIGNSFEFLCVVKNTEMRIISKRTLTLFWRKHPASEQPLKSWFDEAINANWRNPNELKLQFGNASIISDKRVVFNIHGNAYRLVVDIEFRLQIIFIVWIGTHHEYDKIDVRKVEYVKTDSNQKAIQ